MPRDYGFKDSLPLDLTYTRTLLDGHVVREQVTILAGEWCIQVDGIRYYVASRTLVMIPWSRVERVEQFQ